MTHEWTVSERDAGARLDQFLATSVGCSRAAARRLLDADQVRVSGKRARKGMAVQAGDRVTVTGPLPDRASLVPVAQPELALVVLREEPDVVALAKPPGIATHPLRPGETGTLANALVARYPECADVGADPREAGMAHRLDGDTSGCVVAARNQAAWDALRASFHDGRVAKEYLALVAGTVEGELRIDLPLAHDPRDPRRMRVLGLYDDAPDARSALTVATPIASAQGMTLVRVTTATGRMHQVRAHLAHVGHPLVGDALYGGPPALAGAPGHFLHAARLRLPLPSGKGDLDVTAPLPPPRAQALAELGIRID